MAKFLNTSATNYYLEELIKEATDKLILISPYLQLNDRIKELLEDRSRMKIDIRIVYGKVELHPDEINWLKELEYVRTSFCKNLHAKCYLNEKQCIITSLNLYEFSQINNNEMGVLVDRVDDQELYRDTFDEVQRIIRLSEEVRMSLEKVSDKDKDQVDTSNETKLTTSKLAQKLGLKTTELTEILISEGYLLEKGDNMFLSPKGKEAGGQYRKNSHGPYFIWSESLDPRSE